jgi:phage-related protein
MFPVHFQTVKDKTTPNPTEFECLRNLIDQYESVCMKLDDYSLKWVSAFVAECEGMKSFPAAREETLKTITHTCQGNAYMAKQQQLLK